MFVGVYRIELHIPASRSLKAKRAVLNHLKARLARLDLAVAEVEGQDTWQRAVLGAAAVSNDVTYLDDLADRIEDTVSRDPRVMVLRVARDVSPASL